MPQVLEELLEHVEYDRGVGCVAAWQELSSSLVGAFACLQTGNVGQGLGSGGVDSCAQFSHARRAGEFQLAISSTLASESNVTKPELADFATVNDEGGHGIRRFSERPLVYPAIVEPLRDCEHLAESVRYVHTGRADCQLHIRRLTTS